MSIIGGIDLGNLTDYLFYFADGRNGANWRFLSHGYLGNVAVDGIKAAESTTGSFAYAGTIFSNDISLGAWQTIVNNNIGQASGSTGQTGLISLLKTNLINAFQQINALPATSGFESVSVNSLNGLNTLNGINEVFVINITSGFNFTNKINITGDSGDVFIFRWDTDADFSNGYQGTVEPQNGGAFVPLGELTPANFIHVAGKISSQGAGTTPLPPYPQGPRYDNGEGDLITGGEDWTGGGFFTGYWLTTGNPDNFDPISGLYYGSNGFLHDAVFVGGWYTLNTQFQLFSGSSGVYINPNPATFPSLKIQKDVSPDNGINWYLADSPPGPYVTSENVPQFWVTVKNTGNVPLKNILISDDVYGLIATILILLPNQTTNIFYNGIWEEGLHMNTATGTGYFGTNTVSDSDTAYWFGAVSDIKIEKFISTNNGETWIKAETPPGPLLSENINPKFKFSVTNTGNVTLTNISVTDNVLGFIGTLSILNPAEFHTWVIG